MTQQTDEWQYRKAGKTVTFRKVAQLDPRLTALIPGLMHTIEMLQSDGHQPSGVVLPSALMPASGPDGYKMLGLPVTWGDQAGVIVP